ncbi:MAG TPA: SdpI family protein [Candidatus Ventrimonas merdavium]|nr:SdpI family protein [Candidatus Ventrimonas merdavium]
MRSKKIKILVYGIPLLMVLATAAVFGSLPDQIPTQWSLDGGVSYGSRMTLWWFIGLQAFLAVFLDIAPRIDPRKKHYANFAGYYDGFCLMMQLFMSAMWGIVVSESLWPGRISVSRIVLILVGAIFLYAGNQMPKVKSNFYMGIRTPWALSDEEVWYKTHRLGGKTTFLAGVVTIFGGLLMRQANERFLAAVVFGALLLSAGVPTVMSYLWWRQKTRREA